MLELDIEQFRKEQSCRRKYFYFTLPCRETKPYNSNQIIDLLFEKKEPHCQDAALCLFILD